MNLGKTKEFHKFLIKLLSNDEIIKVFIILRKKEYLFILLFDN